MAKFDMQFLERTHTVLDRLSRIIAYAGGGVLLIVAGLVVFEVISRRLFGFTLTGVDEISGFAYAIVMAWGFAFTLFRRGHIRVDALYVRLPVLAQRFLDTLTLLVLLGLMTFLSIRAFIMLQKSWNILEVSTSPLQIPMWIPQSLWLSGLCFFVLCLLVLFLRSIIAFASGRFEVIEEIAHAPDMREEALETAQGSRAED